MRHIPWPMNRKRRRQIKDVERDIAIQPPVATTKDMLSAKKTVRRPHPSPIQFLVKRMDLRSTIRPLVSGTRQPSVRWASLATRGAFIGTVVFALKRKLSHPATFYIGSLGACSFEQIRSNLNHHRHTTTTTSSSP